MMYFSVSRRTKNWQMTDRMRYEGGQYYVKSPEEMARLFPYAPEALENTHKIAERCHVEIEFGVTKLPKFGVPEGYNSWEYLNELCFEGLEETISAGDRGTERTTGPMSLLLLKTWDM